MTRRILLRVCLLAAALLLFATPNALADPIVERTFEERAFIKRREEGMGFRKVARKHVGMQREDFLSIRDVEERAALTVPCVSSVYPGFDVNKVANVGVALGKHSWEYGIITDALLELCSPARSVFSASAFPDGKVPKIRASTHTALRYAKPLIRTGQKSIANGEGSLADPASLTIAAVLIGQTEPPYLTAARRQISTLRAGPKFFNGAISSREDVPELWADAMYMFPPALAYFAPTTQNIDYLKEAVDQSTYYRQVLQANTSASWQGLWVHIVGPQSATYGVWLTGNGWAVLGMVRILATMENWSRCKDWTVRPALIRKYIYEILDGAKASGTSPDNSGLLANYLVGDHSGQNADPAGDFGDAAGTAMLVSVVYRMMVLDPSKAKNYLSWANELRKAVADTVDSKGYVNQTVNPYNWFDNSPYRKGSPEGQAAAVLMAAAYRDCKRAKRC